MIFHNLVSCCYHKYTLNSSPQLAHKGPLTMFLKWALRVPVAWWYSITQLLLRISPLLSLKVRDNQGVSQLVVLSAVMHLSAENFILLRTN